MASKYVKENADGTTTVTFKPRADGKPFQYNGKEYTSITLRGEANLEDVEAMERVADVKDRWDAGIRLAASLSAGIDGFGMPHQAIRKLPLSDILRIVATASKSVKIETEEDEEGEEKKSQATGATS